MGPLPPFTLRDFSQGRISQGSVNTYLAPPNSVKDSMNVNYDTIIGSGVVRRGTTLVGDPVSPDHAPLGLTALYAQGGGLLGGELVTNGTFTGSAAGWTLGDGWSYGTNNALWTALSTELITNGTFTGSATGWTLNSVTYGSNDVVYANSSGGEIFQNGLTFSALKLYRVSVGYSSGVAGSNSGVSVEFQNPSFSPQVAGMINNAGAGTFTGDLRIDSNIKNRFYIGNSAFVGTIWRGHIDNVSVKRVNEGALSQDVGAVTGLQYQVSVTAGGSAGNLIVSLGGTTFSVPAGTTVTYRGFATGSAISITASDDFNGTVDNVSVKAILSNILFVVFAETANAVLYYYFAVTGVWVASNLNSLTLGAKNRFATLGNYEFISNAVDGMFSSPDGVHWTAGTAANCIEPDEAKPNLLQRYAGRLLAAGDPNFSDRIYFSSIIEPASSPFITWDTNETTGDWIDVNPDDGGNITGFSESSTFLLVFKDNGMYRLDAINKTVDTENIFNIGAVSQEAITLCQGVTYFFSGIDIRRTNGGYPEQISRLGVQDIVEAVPQANWVNIGSGTDGLNVWWSLGDVTLNQNTDNERTIQNCVIKFSPRDETWSIHSYANQYTFFTGFVDELGFKLRGADTVGNVQTIDLGTRDATGLVEDMEDVSIPIYYELETQDLEFGNRSHLKSISDKIAVFTKNGDGGSINFREDGSDLKQVPSSDLSTQVAILQDINIEGHFVNFRWSGVAGDVAPIFEGFYIEDITDEGFTHG